MDVDGHLDGGVLRQVLLEHLPGAVVRAVVQGVVDGGVVDNPKARGLQGLFQGLPGGHHALLLVSGAGLHIRVVKARVALGVGLAGVGVVDEDFHAAILFQVDRGLLLEGGV